MVTLDSVITPLLINEKGVSPKQIFGMLDSAAYQDFPPYNPNIVNLTYQCQQAYQLYLPPLGTACQSQYGGSDESDPWQCVMGQYALPLVMQPAVQPMFMYDSYQLSVDFGDGSDPNTWTSDQLAWAQDPFRTGMTSIGKTSQGPWCASFFFTPSPHSILYL